MNRLNWSTDNTLHTYYGSWMGKKLSLHCVWPVMAVMITQHVLAGAHLSSSSSTFRKAIAFPAAQHKLQWSTISHANAFYFCNNQRPTNQLDCQLDAWHKTAPMAIAFHRNQRIDYILYLLSAANRLPNNWTCDRNCVRQQQNAWAPNYAPTNDKCDIIKNEAQCYIAFVTIETMKNVLSFFILKLYSSRMKIEIKRVENGVYKLGVSIIISCMTGQAARAHHTAWKWSKPIQCLTAQKMKSKKSRRTSATEIEIEEKQRNWKKKKEARFVIRCRWRKPQTHTQTHTQRTLANSTDGKLLYFVFSSLLNIDLDLVSVSCGVSPAWRWCWADGAIIVGGVDKLRFVCTRFRHDSHKRRGRAINDNRVTMRVLF